MRKDSRRRDACWVVLALVLVSSPFLRAQQTGGSARGVVRRRTGAAVAQAEITASDVQTGQTRTATSNEQGEFEIRGLPPGRYNFKASHAGLAAQTKNGVTLAPDRTVTLEFVLAAVSESPTGAAANRISQNQLVGLPLNGRSYNQLATLEAGVTDTGGEQASRGVGGGSLTVSGGRASSNNFLLDGTTIMDTGNSVPQSAAGVQLGSDAIYQVQVFSTNYSAEYGRGSGGILNSITRSGTEKFHADLFEYFRNSKLDSRNFFDRDPLNPLRRSSPPPFKRNQFGFTVTGPVWKNKTYFMGSYEAMRDRLSETVVNFFPDAQARLGVITDASGQVLRRVTVSPKVEPYLALYPMPNSDSVGGGFARNLGSQFEPTNENFLSVRVDHRLNDRDSFFARYVFDDASSVSGQDTLPFRTLTNSRQQYLTLVGTHIFSLTALNSFRLGYTRPVDALDTLSSINIPASLLFTSHPVFGQIELPGTAAFGPASGYPERNVMNSFQFSDDVVLQRGRHALKFGAQVHRYRWDVFNSSYQGGVWTFNSLESFLQAGPSGTNLVVALPGSNNRKSYRQTLVGLYIEDNFQVTPHLQWNLGLRYEAASIISEKYGRVAYLPDPVHDTSVQIGPMLKKNPSLLDFSPRIGFTWSPPRWNNTIVSGGFGIYYDPLLEYVIDLEKNSAPFYRRVVRPNFDSSTTFPDAAAAASGLEAATPFQVEVLDYNHMASPRVLRYDFAVEQRLFGSLRLHAAYVGARGNHLFRGYEANQYPVPITRADGSLFFPPNSGPVNPAFGAIRLTSTDAQSFYNALQLSGGTTTSRGISLQVSYVFSKSVDDTSTFSSGESRAYERQYPLMRTLDRGLSDFDIRHRLTVNYFYTLPFGAGRQWLRSGLLSHFLGAWRLGGIVSFRTGSPFHPLVNVQAPGYLFVADRPNLQPGASNNPTGGVSAGCEGVAPGTPLGGPNLYFDPCAFSAPEPGTLGNAGRNTIIGPSVFSADISLQKEFALGGEKKLQFRTEIFNVPNHANFALPSTGSSTVFTGFPARAGSTAGTITRTTTTSRQIQFALRFAF